MNKNKKILIFETKNPFINLAYQIKNNDQYLEKDVVNLFYTLLDSNLIEKYSINESFFVKNNYHSDDFSVEKLNIFSLLSSLEIGDTIDFLEYQQFFNRLFKEGLIIDYPSHYLIPDLNNIKNRSELLNYIEDEKIIATSEENNIFQLALSENKCDFFLTHLFHTLSFKDFLSKIKYYETYHKAVSFNKYNILNLLNTLNIPVDILDKDYNTPLMFCRNIEILEKIDQFKPNWFLQNINGEDAYSSFVYTSDEEQRKIMLSYAKKRMEENINISSSNHKNQEYIDERVKFNLLKLVNSDKTKKEIQDFIKKNKPKDIGNIYDENGNNLLMISLSKNNWARANLFLNVCDINHINNLGESISHILLSKNSTYITKINDMLPFLTASLDVQAHKKSEQSLFLYLIHKQFNNNYNYNSLPIWLIDNATLFLPKLGFSIEKSYKIKNDYTKLKNTTTKEENEQTIFALKLFLEGFKYENKTFNLNFDEIYQKIYTKTKHYQNEYYNYNVDKNLINIFNILLKEIKNYNIECNLDKIEFDYQTYIINFIFDGYNNHVSLSSNYAKNAEDNNEFNKDSFIKNIVPLMEHLIENEYFHVLNQLPKELIFSNHFSKELQTALRFVFLNNSVEDKQEINSIKRNKI